MRILHSFLPRDSDAIHLLVDMHHRGCVLILTLSYFAAHIEGSDSKANVTTATSERGKGDSRLTEESKANGVKNKGKREDNPNRLRVAIFIANILIKALEDMEQA